MNTFAMCKMHKKSFHIQAKSKNRCMPCATWVTSINEAISSEPILAKALETPVIDKKEQETTVITYLKPN